MLKKFSLQKIFGDNTWNWIDKLFHRGECYAFKKIECFKKLFTKKKF